MVTDFYRRDFEMFGLPTGKPMRLNKPFIRLPLRFDAARLAFEAGHVEARKWMPHPSAMRGNSALALISSGGGDNDSFDGEKAPTAASGGMSPTRAKPWPASAKCYRAHAS